MAKTKIKGRPAGSPNKDYAGPIEEIPPACPKCKSVNLTKFPGSKVIDRPLNGVLPSGFRFAAVRWTRKKCICGQMLTVKTYFPASDNPKPILSEQDGAPDASSIVTHRPPSSPCR